MSKLDFMPVCVPLGLLHLEIWPAFLGDREPGRGDGSYSLIVLVQYSTLDPGNSKPEGRSPWDTL